MLLGYDPKDVETQKQVNVPSVTETPTQTVEPQKVTETVKQKPKPEPEKVCKYKIMTFQSFFHTINNFCFFFSL